MIPFLHQDCSDDFGVRMTDQTFYQGGKCFLLQYICFGQTSLSFNIKIADGDYPKPCYDNLDILYIN